ncbi:MAG TPA: nitroreductase family protein [Bryobacteraceae bacterium]|nr:nitroreductase family protein [Bryobacteraceae bacterium]
MTQKRSTKREDVEAQKLADTKYPIEDALRRRCSTLAFAARPVEVAKLRQLFEAARWAPSSFNEQPWSFLLTTKDEGPEDYERLASCLIGHNRDWAVRAPVLVLSIAKRHFEIGGRVNQYSAHDVGLATENLIIQATAVNLFVHLIAGFDGARARELFAIPNTHEPVCVFAIGYFGDLETLPADLQRRELAPRQRRPFRDFVFSGRWGEPTTLIPD